MKNKVFDIIIIGGGATGSGIALDAASRSLKVLILEKNDFSEGTSSRSTKLVHGGVRYLESAVKNLDKSQFNLVKEGLDERYILLKNAPHLSSVLALITPLYKWWQIPYMFIGLSLYDFISGKKGLGRSSIVNKKYIIENFPFIKKDGLLGGIKYYDGTFNDSRLNISLLQTAKKHGAICKNYYEVRDFLYINNKISGVKVFDKISNKNYEFKAKVVVNATGIFSDKIRKLDDKEACEMLELSSGVHIIIDKKYLPSREGLMIPKTEDGRVLFILPWMGKCLVGTTDEKTILKQRPEVLEKDINYILKHLEIYFDLKIKKEEILSSWCGIRPLLCSDKNTPSSSLVRDYLISSSTSGLVSIMGGKWTIYRKMAEELLEYINSEFSLNIKKCKTKKLKLIGSENYKNISLKKNIDKNISKHLLSLYGDKAENVLLSVKRLEILHPKYFYTNAEIIYCIREEFVKKPLDFLVRRSSLALIDKQASKDILEKVVQIMSTELLWSEEKIKKEYDEAIKILNTFI